MKSRVIFLVAGILISLQLHYEFSIHSFSSIIGLKTYKHSEKEFIQKTLNEKLLYKGSWFDIQYPSNFSPKPVSPINTFNNANNIITDEATFISPDKSVEFFVYSPQWSGNPKNYLEKTSNEILISENISKNPQEFVSLYGDTVIKTVIFQASDESYFRSYTSIMQQVGTQSPLHHVFGIKYKNDVSYKRYKNAYEQFKKSLHQYAD